MQQTQGPWGRGWVCVPPVPPKGPVPTGNPQCLPLTCEGVSAESQIPLLRRQLQVGAGAKRSHRLGACVGLGGNRDGGEGTEESSHSLGVDSREGSWNIP